MHYEVINIINLFSGTSPGCKRQLSSGHPNEHLFRACTSITRRAFVLHQQNRRRCQPEWRGLLCSFYQLHFVSIGFFNDPSTRNNLPSLTLLVWKSASIFSEKIVSLLLINGLWFKIQYLDQLASTAIIDPLKYFFVYGLDMKYWRWYYEYVYKKM